MSENSSRNLSALGSSHQFCWQGSISTHTNGSECEFSVIDFFGSLPHPNPSPGLVQKVDQRLPVANEYLLLSGGAREGVLDLNPEDLGDYAKGADFDLDFTLLVPALKLHDRNQPVTLDMRHSPPCHSWLSLRLCDSNILSRWDICCQEENGLLTEEDEDEEGEMGE